jgi:NaMN:DMB phosphoribosyltransferase
VQPTADPPTTTLTSDDIDIRPGLVLPLPDDAAAAAARERLSIVDIGVPAPTIAALGMLAEAVVFMAAVQTTAYPRPVLSTRVVLLTGSHAGGIVAGPAPDPRNAAPLQHMAINAGAGVVTLEWQPASAAIELEDAITVEQMDASLRAGWAEAERAADEGIELLVLAAGGAGSAVAAAAVVAAITGAEPTMLLTRVVTPAGLYDDNAWMTRCLALRDALHRVRNRDGDPRTVLAALGGADIAAATGLILGAASRRTPVMIDGPVGAAAALLANDFSPQSRSWVVLPDTGRHPAVRLAADSLQLRPWLDLCLDLGEGATSLSALPMLQTALTLAGAGEEVEPQPLTRFDSTGNQIFVGVAKAVDPAEEETEEGYTGSTVETAPVMYTSANAVGEPAAAKAVAADGTGAATTDENAKAGVAKPADAKPSGTKPSETKAQPAKAGETKVEPVKATAAKPAEAKPAEAKAAEATAADVKVADAKPLDGKPAAAKPADAKPAETKPAEAKPADGTPAVPKPSATLIADTKPAAGEPADARPTESKPGDTRPSDAKPGDSKPGDSKPGESKATPAKAGVKPPTRTATKPPPAKAAPKPALTGRTAASKTVPPKAKDAVPAKETPTTPEPSTKDARPALDDPTLTDVTRGRNGATPLLDAALAKAGSKGNKPAPGEFQAAAPVSDDLPDDDSTEVVGAGATPPRPRRKG